MLLILSTGKSLVWVFNQGMDPDLVKWSAMVPFTRAPREPGGGPLGEERQDLRKYNAFLGFVGIISKQSLVNHSW